MAKGIKTGGRVKGSLNKTTQTAKDAIALAADNLGGATRLYEWAQSDPDNEKAFWVSIYPKLLPLQVNSELNLSGSVNQVKTIRLIDLTSE